MKKRQTNLLLFTIIVVGLIFVGMQAFVPTAGLAQDNTNEASITVIQSAGPHDFYPVTPCRISDSRTFYAPWAQGEYRGPFPVGTTLCFSNWGSESFIYPQGADNIGRQGGNQAGCPSPANWDTGGFHVVVTSVPVWGSGHVRLYPADVPMPMASVLSWSAHKGNDSVAVSAGSSEEYWSDDDFCIYIGGPATGGSTHIIMDVMGYFN